MPELSGVLHGAGGSGAEGKVDMTAWLELHQDLLTHKKTLALADRLDMHPLHAVSHVIAIWLWAIDGAPGGNLKGMSARAISRVAQWEGDPETFCSALFQAGFFDVDDEDNFCIHDWAQYAGRLIEKREQNRARTEKNRANKNTECEHSNENSEPYANGSQTVCEPFNENSEQFASTVTVPGTVPKDKKQKIKESTPTFGGLTSEGPVSREPRCHLLTAREYLTRIGADPPEGDAHYILLNAMFELADTFPEKQRNRDYVYRLFLEVVRDHGDRNILRVVHDLRDHQLAPTEKVNRGRLYVRLGATLRNWLAVQKPEAEEGSDFYVPVQEVQQDRPAKLLP